MSVFSPFLSCCLKIVSMTSSAYDIICEWFCLSGTDFVLRSFYFFLLPVQVKGNVFFWMLTLLGSIPQEILEKHLQLGGSYVYSM